MEAVFLCLALQHQIPIEFYNFAPQPQNLSAMKALKRMGLGFLVTLVSLFVISLFLPSERRVERSLVMEVTPEEAYAMVSDLEKWPLWMPWLQYDPNMEITYGEITQGAGATYSWSSKEENVGAGSMSIDEVVPNESMVTTITFEGSGSSAGHWKFEKVAGGTNVTWSIDLDVSNPPVVGRLFGIFIDGMIGPDFETGLSNIDSVMQLAPATPAYSIEITEEHHDAFPFIAMNDSCVLSGDSISAHYAAVFGQLGAHCGANGITITANPYALVTKWEPASGWYWYQGGFPIAETVEVDAPMISGMSYEGPVVKGIHIGDYNTMNVSHEEIVKYIKDQGLTMAGNPWEHYVDDPTLVTDYRTIIYYPVQ